MDKFEIKALRLVILRALSTFIISVLVDVFCTIRLVFVVCLCVCMCESGVCMFLYLCAGVSIRSSTVYDV